MELTRENFCPNVKNVSTLMRTTYICNLSGKVCPKVDYRSGKALPSNTFIKNGCPLIEKESEQIEEVKEKVEEPKKEIVEDVKEEIIEPVVATAEEIIEKPIQQDNKPKTNNYKKKKTNNKK